MKTAILLSALALFVSAALAQTCGTVYQQCGGIGFTGPTCCTASVCTYSNAYYSQCLPGTASTTTTTTPTTTHTTTTTTTTHTTGTGSTTTVVVTTTATVTSTILSTVTVSSCTSTTSHSVSTTTTTTTPHTSTTTTSVVVTTTTGGSTGFTPGPTPPTTNPFIGAKFYVNTLWTAEVANFVAADSTIACAQSELNGVSTAVWLDTIAAISNMTWHLQQAAIQAAGQPIVIIFVIYDLPGRDCHALASNGEIPAGDDAEYKNNYIAPIVNILKTQLQSNIRVVLIIEPDSLPNGATNLGTMNCTQAVISGYEADIAYAISQLTMGNVWQYMDVGHGGWLGWPSPGLQNIGPILQGVINTAKSLNPLFFLRGWITNTANYDPWNSNDRPAKDPTATWMSCNNYPIHPAGFTLCYDYNAAINEWIFQTEILGPTLAALGLPQTFLFDSSRSGQPGIRENWGSWCNINGAGIGPRPAVTPDSTAPNLDAFVWIKPPGESDGNSSPLANHPAVDGFCDCTTANGVDSLCPSPQAGQPFQAHFSMMVHNANPTLGTC